MRGEVKSATVNIRVPQSVYDRLNEAADRAGVARSAWAFEAIVWALEREEQAMIHVPEQIIEAMPRRVGAKMIMPRGRIMPTIQRN
jgi:hypothetical protein